MLEVQGALRDTVSQLTTSGKALTMLGAQQHSADQPATERRRAEQEVPCSEPRFSFFSAAHMGPPLTICETSTMKRQGQEMLNSKCYP